MSWKTTSVSGDQAEEYRSLMATAPGTPEGTALMDLLDQLEAISERIDPKRGRMRVARCASRASAAPYPDPVAVRGDAHWAMGS